MNSGAELVSKARFAELEGVGKSAVSNWIKAGHITGPALVGEGRGAMINVAVARQQLGRALDPSQRLAQVTVAGRRSADLAPAGDDESARYQRARADMAEIEARRARQRELAEAGTYMLTADARAMWARELAGLVQAIELWLPRLAEQLAGAISADQRRLTVEARRAWRAFRQERSDLATSALAGTPELATEA